MGAMVDRRAGRTFRSSSDVGNFRPCRDDYSGMRCEQCRELLSAGFDGEASEIELAAAHQHAESCSGCRAFAAGAARLHRGTRLAPAPAVPDLTATVLAAIGADERARRSAPVLGPLRLVLAVIAALEIAAAIPALLLGNDSGLSAHAARHAGSFTLAIGIGFLYLAWRPRRASGLLVVAGALAACLVLASVLDVATGHASALSEVQHAPEVVGLLTAWLLHRQISDEGTALKVA